MHNLNSVQLSRIDAQQLTPKNLVATDGGSSIVLKLKKKKNPRHETKPEGHVSKIRIQTENF